MLGRWAPAPNVRLRAGGNPATTDHPIDSAGSDFEPPMWNAVGGSTVAWAAHFPRLHPSDLRPRAPDGVGDDWPFDDAAFGPWHDRADRALGVAGLAGDPASPPKPARPMPPHALGRLGMAAARVRAGFGRSMAVLVMNEDLPEPGNRVSLAAEPATRATPSWTSNAGQCTDNRRRQPNRPGPCHGRSWRDAPQVRARYRPVR